MLKADKEYFFVLEKHTSLFRTSYVEIIYLHTINILYGSQKMIEELFEIKIKILCLYIFHDWNGSCRLYFKQIIESIQFFRLNFINIYLVAKKTYFKNCKLENHDLISSSGHYQTFLLVF